MPNTKYLEKSSGPLFFTGFIASKLQYVPFAAAAAAFRFASLGLYLIAYSFWFAASYNQPEHERANSEWYGFAQIKEQFLFSSLAGFIATVVSVAAIFVPALFPPAAWLFVLGNTFWTIGEYHKLNNPPKDQDFSYSQQEAYTSYAASTSIISVVSAISATIMFIYPPITMPLSIFSILVCAGFGVLACEYLLDYNFGDHPTTFTSSADAMEKGLGAGVSPQNDPTNNHAPIHTKQLFQDASSVVQESVNPIVAENMAPNNLAIK
ncbi:hypothetical protein [Legionella rowbothamii]|uniref:hypothetical protein n=1 Tax=Legionella rowbothamii TaxID=96229 RepID=UPI0010542CBF|nr:hypothetical protein [Legionella rowbothamii]